MLENLISEGIGVIVELIAVYFLINYLIDKREKKKWKSVMDLIIYNVERIEGWFCVGFTAMSKQTTEDFNLAGESLRRVRIHQKKLTKIIDLTGAGLGSDVVPSLLEVLEQIETLIEKLDFTSLVFSEKENNKHYIMTTPLEQLRDLQEHLKKLAESNEYEFETKGTDPSLRANTVSTWNDFVENGPLFENPVEYQARKHKKIHVFDVDTMTKLGRMKVGNSIQCFKMQ
jgi:hypothetical protein